ncbi:hypothetical protein R6V09_09645 [Streptomyces sp. W16]|uniref:hypothetical protein n=1 Tax=Streptomyces sp. W16 TaxID=3076631 RepID=UPI00295B3F21|nr:hypothetical protein [Streptomyces sp. W16]MDV9170398.1 hypothetical protein [Streptomyces sp. W16]
MFKLRASLRAVTVAAVLVSGLVAVPQAVAAGRPAVPVAKTADAATRAIAKADPQPASAAATVCGTGYSLFRAVPLPEGTDPNQRLAMLFSYENNGKGCVILDNNVGKSQYMYLHVCKVDNTGCSTDSGNFSEYAGPLYVASAVCAPVTAKMGATSSSLYINYATEYMFSCD